MPISWQSHKVDIKRVDRRSRNPSVSQEGLGITRVTTSFGHEVGARPRHRDRPDVLRCGSDTSTHVFMFLADFFHCLPSWLPGLGLSTFFQGSSVFFFLLSHPVQDKEAVLSDDGKIMPRSAHVGDMIISYNGCGYRRIDPVWLSFGTIGPSK